MRAAEKLGVGEDGGGGGPGRGGSLGAASQQTQQVWCGWEVYGLLKVGGGGVIWAEITVLFFTCVDVF